MDNVSLFFSIYNFSHHFQLLDSLMVFTTQYVVYLTGLLMIILAFKGKTKEKRAILLAILALPIAILLIKAIHIIYMEPRPFVSFHFLPLADNTPDASFPSRHATIMAVIAFAYTFFKSKWSALFLFFMLAVGISRIYVGVHYPLDIIGGFLVGIIALAIAFCISKILAKIFI